MDSYKRTFRGRVSEALLVAKLQWRLAFLLSSRSERQVLLRRLRLVSKRVPCPHDESEVLSIGMDILSIPEDREGCILEAGAYKGASTAKLSLFAKLAGRELLVLDSFEGMPENSEDHKKSILGHSLMGWFSKGTWRGSLEEVKRNVTAYGSIETCTFIPGWFEETLPKLSRKVSIAFLDVDLASSTRLCLKYIYPLLVPGGILYSHDGDIPLVIEVFKDIRLWEDEVGYSRPTIEGLGKKKLLRVVKGE